ncbi:MAG: GNAT family protein [Candidatus Cloacimonetes bacterium]|nr:GNAT family protein [Candidatus Cloacimonadota bacterium]
MLYGKKVILRALKGEDLSQLVKLHNDASIKSLAAMHQFPVSPELEAAWLESILMDKSNTRAYFGIESVSDGLLAGICFLQSINWVDRIAWFGIAILAQNQGKGFGREALDLIVQYGFETLNLQKISLYVLAINDAAIKLYTQKGFVTEGTLRNHCNYQGKLCDLQIMSLFRETPQS